MKFIRNKRYFLDCYSVYAVYIGKFICNNEVIYQFEDSDGKVWEVSETDFNKVRRDKQ
jgi:hypothetical protein